MKNWLIGGCLLLCQTALFAATPWQQLRQPVNDAPQSIGTYQNGCVIGAARMPTGNPAYQLTHPNDNRKFGHPQLIDYLNKLAKKVNKQGLGILLISDMGMPAGGRFNSGHNSHQTGLDVDIALQLPKQPMTLKQLNKPNPIYLVAAQGKQVIDSRWKPEIFNLLKNAAEDDRVARIFVHPAIKLRLCNEASNNNRQWLGKIRPWFGHRAHMHVRLLCPKDNAECINQELPPKGDGCGDELMSWLQDNNLPNAKPRDKPAAIPATCQRLLNNNFYIKK